MRIPLEKEGMTDQEKKKLAYWERNMIALVLASHLNNTSNILLESMGIFSQKEIEELSPCGWYFDTDNNWEGWKRVLSLNNGRMCFHIQDDFDLGSLPQIEPNWDGHTTKTKWIGCMDFCDCVIEKEDIDA